VDRHFSQSMQTDGNIVVAGVTGTDSNADIALVRYDTNGTVDTSFHGDGKLTTPIGADNDEGRALALQSNGKILVAAVSSTGGQLEFAAARYNPDGSLDGSYGNGGKVVVAVTDHDDEAYSMALDSIGRAIIVGDADRLFGVVRLLGDPFLKIFSISSLTNGVLSLRGVGIPGRSHTIRASANVSSGRFDLLGPVATDADGLWQYDDASVGNSANRSNRFYLLSFP